MLLYNYLEVDETLKWLSSEDLGVPSLPGTERKINSERPKVSCRDEENMMKKFHNCFSDQLLGLH